MNPWNYDIQTLEREARAVRCHIVRLNASNSAGGHTGADLSQIGLLTILCFHIPNVAPERIAGEAWDIYTQSKGHAVGCYCCALTEVGFFPVGWLETYQHTSSHLPGHPVCQKTPGIEPNTNALSHGLSVAVGLALAAKKGNNSRRIFLVTGDDELVEESNQEAAPAAAHYGLDNLIITNDKNNLQLAGSTREIMNTDPLAAKWQTFGVTVTECQGNDMASIVATLEGLKQDGEPNVIITSTTKGTGTSLIQGCPEWHHRVPKGEEIELTLRELRDE